MTRPRSARPALGQPLHHLREHRRRDGEVEHRSLGPLQPARQLVVERGVAVVADEHRQALRQLAEGGLVDRAAGGGLDRLARVRAQPLVLPGRARDADHRHAEPAHPGHLVQRRHELLAHQVAGRPEQDDGVRPTAHAVRSSRLPCRRPAACRASHVRPPGDAPGGLRSVHVPDLADRLGARRRRTGDRDALPPAGAERPDPRAARAGRRPRPPRRAPDVLAVVLTGEGRAFSAGVGGATLTRGARRPSADQAPSATCSTCPDAA